MRYNTGVKYLSQTFSYLKRNFWLPLVVMTAPALIACFLSTPYWEVAFITAFDYDPFVSTRETFRILFGDSWAYIWPVVIISLFQIVGATLVTSAADQHFRTGKLSIDKPFKLMNNVIFPMTLGVIVMCVISIIWRFVIFGLVTLVQAIAVTASFDRYFTLAIIAIVAIALFVLHVMVLMPILYWAPSMYLYGYRFRDAAGTSLKLISGKKVFRNLFLPLVVLAAVQLTVAFFQPHVAVVRVVSFFVSLATNMFVPVFVIVSFYDISGLERRDIMPHERVPLPEVTKKPPKKRKGGDDVL